MHIKSYQFVDSLQFDISVPSNCVALYGEPKAIRKSRHAATEYHYDRFILRFDPESETLRECTLLPYKVATINDIEVTWDRKFLTMACAADGDAKEYYGFIILRNLGIAITGIHDDDTSQLAVGAVKKGLFDEFMKEAVPFESHS